MGSVQGEVLVTTMTDVAAKVGVSFVVGMLLDEMLPMSNMIPKEHQSIRYQRRKETRRLRPWSQNSTQIQNQEPNPGRTKCYSVHTRNTSKTCYV